MTRLTAGLRRIIVALAAATAVLLAAGPAHAADTADVATIDIDQAGVLLITGLVLPVIVGLATKLGASSKLKALTNFVAAGIAAFITNAVDDTGHAVFSLAQLRDWVLVFTISTVTYLGLAKPLDLPAKLAPNHGLGRAA